MEDKVGHNLDDFMLQFQKVPLEESRHGKSLTLGDYNIKNGNTLFLLKVGITLNITNPQVHLFIITSFPISQGKKKQGI
ncbi:MAG: hypothetical protein MJE68_01015 [Proteobacteria bacterium]|nr:hypothetical protein [Pseudomonadota bacterium]